MNPDQHFFHQNYLATRAAILPAKSQALLEELHCWPPKSTPSNEELAQATHVTVRTASRHLGILEEKELITRAWTPISRGYQRTIKLTPVARAWIRDGVVPAHLASEV